MRRLLARAMPLVLLGEHGAEVALADRTALQPPGKRAELVEGLQRQNVSDGNLFSSRSAHLRRAA
jgi:hypothetical protein